MSSSFTMTNKVNLFKPFTKHLFELQRSDKWTRKLDRIETQQGDVQVQTQHPKFDIHSTSLGIVHQLIINI